MKRLLKSFIMLCSISLVLSLTACGNPNTETENESGDEGGNDTTIQILAEPFALSDTGNPFGNEEEGTADIEGHKYVLTNVMKIEGSNKIRATRLSEDKILYYRHRDAEELFNKPEYDFYAVITVKNSFFDLYDVEYKYIKYGDEILVSDGTVLNQTKLNDNKVQTVLFGDDKAKMEKRLYDIYDMQLTEFIIDPADPSNYTLDSSSITVSDDGESFTLDYTGSGKYLYYTSVQTGGKSSDSYSCYEYTRQGAETFTNTDCNYITEAVTVIRKTQLNKGYNDYTYYFDCNANPKKIFVKGAEERYGEDPEDVIYYWINGYITEKDDGNWDESNISYTKYNSDQDPASMFTDWQNGAFYYLSLTVQIKPDGTFIGKQNNINFEGTYGAINPISGEIPLTCTILEQAGITIKCQSLQDGKVLKFYEEIPDDDPSNNLNAEYCYTLIRK